MELWGLADSYPVFKRLRSAVISSIEPDSSYSLDENSSYSALGSPHVTCCYSFTGAFAHCPVFISVYSHLPQDWALPGPQPGLLQLWIHCVIGTKEEWTKEDGSSLSLAEWDLCQWTGVGRAARLQGTEKRDNKKEKRLLSNPGPAGRGDVLG